MNDEQKRPPGRPVFARFTGMAALAALAVLVLPVVFDGKPDEYERLMRPVPRPPLITVPEVNGDRLLRDMEAMEERTLAAMPEPIPAPAPATAADFTLDEQGLPVVWTLQVGTFARQDNAFQLLAGLRELGYKAYALKHGRLAERGDELIRVMVGPMQSREALAGIALEIQADFQVSDVKLLPYRIEEDRHRVEG